MTVMAQLASLGDEVKIWDVSSFALTEQFYNSTDSVKDLGWNHDGTLLATSCKNSNSINVRQMVVGAKVRSSISHSFDLPSPCCCVDFGSKFLLAACEDGMLQILDLQTKKLHKSYTVNKFPITVARWNWNEKNIAFGCQTGQIMLYNVITGQASSPFKPLSSQAVNQLKYNPYLKSSLASASEDGVVAFWDTNTRCQVHKFNSSHQAPAMDLAFSPVNDHLMVSVGLDKRLVLYDIHGKKSIKTIVADYPLTSLDMHDGSIVTVGTSRGKILVYDLRKVDMPVVTIPAHKSSVKRICYSKKEVASPGASQPNEISLSNYYENATSSATNNNTSNSLGAGPARSFSYLHDESSTNLTHSHNNNSSSYVGHMMSPAVSGHPLPYSRELSRSGVSSVNSPGASGLYSWLQNESSHHLSHKEGADNMNNYQDISFLVQEQYTSKDQIDGEVASPRATDDMRSTPPQRLAHTAADPGRSPNSVHFKLASPMVDHSGSQAAPVNGHISSSSYSGNRARTDSSNPAYPSSDKTHSKMSSPRQDYRGSQVNTAVNGHTSTSPHTSHRSRTDSGDMHHLKKAWLEDFKSEVKALIKDELKQPQVADTSSASLQQMAEGQQDKVRPEMFQEEYLRKLIRDELETFAEQCHRDYNQLEFKMSKLHFDMWWWLDQRFSEQLSNPTLVEQINKLTEEVNRLRRGYRY